ncbi:CDP-glycerol glycerophosphotransferase family protein [Streptomyces thinghirensis]|nr:CDP-glycerol glycerophosphotransferase family protein [Streptomyces thinghirensis]
MCRPTGTPLKTMGLDQQRFPASTDMDFEKLLERCDRWDFSISANRFSTVIWERVYPLLVHDAGDRLPAQRRPVNATSEDVRAARAALGRPTAPRRSSTADAPRVPAGLHPAAGPGPDRRRTRAGRDLLVAALLTAPARRRTAPHRPHRRRLRAPPGGGGCTSPRTP